MAPRSFRLWLSGSVVLVAGWIVYRFPPATTPWYPRCLFHMLTGLDCPGCGGTRAVYQLLHGNFSDAFKLNPLLFVFLIPVALCSLPSFIRGENPKFMSTPWFGWTSAVVLTVFWVGRNLV